MFRVTRTNNFRVLSSAPFPQKHTFNSICSSNPAQVKRTTSDGNNLPTRRDMTPSSEESSVVSNPKNEKTLSATDVLAPTTMKNAAKCDTSCELRNPVSHQNFERILHFLRGVCLLECLFIPTSPPLLRLCCGTLSRPLLRHESVLSSRRDGHELGLRSDSS